MHALALVLWVVAAAAPVQQQIHASATANRSNALFESDWVLMNWALKFYDSDRDILLSPNEAQRAANRFRTIADADGDGRVTPNEYRAAREFILARY